jgi:hypothetical protein
VVAVKQRDVGRLIAVGSVFGLATLTAGCTIARWYNGAPLRATASVLVEGQSTKTDVLKSFGPPTQITHQTDGDAFVYTYDRLNFSSFTLQEPITGFRLFTYRREFNNHDRLVVLFDFAGVVRGVAVEHHTGELPVL